jgi:hypothetical protein
MDDALYRLLADLIVLIHLAFVLFAVGGGLLVAWRRRWAWVHLPAAAWAALVEFGGWICPLTPLENWFRAKAGMATYSGDFVARTILPILYPEKLTRGVQILLGLLVVGVNAACYATIFMKRRRPAGEGDG